MRGYVIISKETTTPKINYAITEIQLVPVETTVK
jgi:hypothetical protein